MVTAVRLFLNSLFLALLIGNSAYADDWLVRQRILTGFDEVKESIVTAIENRGLVVNYTSHIATMLDRTGNDIGASRRIYDRAEIIEFCSASLSRKMMEADPHNIVLCPFAISIYVLPGEKATWVSYRKPMGEAAIPVMQMLSDIVAEAGP